MRGGRRRGSPRAAGARARSTRSASATWSRGAPVTIGVRPHDFAPAARRRRRGGDAEGRARRGARLRGVRARVAHARAARASSRGSRPHDAKRVQGRRRAPARASRRRTCTSSTRRPGARSTRGEARSRCAMRALLRSSRSSLACAASRSAHASRRARRPLALVPRRRGAGARASSSQRYEREHPASHVDAARRARSRRTRRSSLAAIPHAHGPDLFIEAHERLGRLPARRHRRADRATRSPTRRRRLRRRPPSRAVTLDGARYGVPLASKCLALYVNDDLLPKTPRDARGDRRAPARVAARRASTRSSTRHENRVLPRRHSSTRFGGRLHRRRTASSRFVGDEAARVARLRARARHEQGRRPGGAERRARRSSSSRAAAPRPPSTGRGSRRSRSRASAYRVEPLPAHRRAGGARMRPLLTVEAVMRHAATAPRSPRRARFARWLGRTSRPRSCGRAIGHQVVAPRRGVGSDRGRRRRTRVLARVPRGGRRRRCRCPRRRAMRAAWVPANQAIRKVLRGEIDRDRRARRGEAPLRGRDAPAPAAARRPRRSLVARRRCSLLAGAFLAVRRARTARRFARELRASLPAYRYVTHAVVAVFVLVVLPLARRRGDVALRRAARATRATSGSPTTVAILTARGGPLLGARVVLPDARSSRSLWTVVNVALHLGIGLVARRRALAADRAAAGGLPRAPHPPVGGARRT